MLETNGWHIIELPEIFKVGCITGHEISKQVSFILELEAVTSDILWIIMSSTKPGAYH